MEVLGEMYMKYFLGRRDQVRGYKVPRLTTHSSLIVYILILKISINRLGLLQKGHYKSPFVCEYLLMPLLVVGLTHLVFTKKFIGVPIVFLGH